MTTDPNPAEESPVIAPGVDVVLPNGATATVGLTSGASALVRVENASAWYPIAALKVAP